MRLRPETWRLRVFWWTHVVVAAGLGLFGSVLAVLVSLVLLVDATTVSTCGSVNPTPPNFEAPPYAHDPEARAREFVQAMANDDFQAAYEMLAVEQWDADSLCPFDLEGFWRKVTGGGDVKLVAVNQSDSAFFAPIFNFLEVPLWVTLESAQGHRDVHLEVRLHADGRIAGYEINSLMTEVGADRTFPPPPYAEPDTFEETEVQVGQAPWELKGTITVPVGSGPFPAVVLMGARDRDGTGSTAKLLRDEAWGLATHGVASLRFDRRTYAHALATARQESFTIDDELVDDTLAAVQILRRTPRIDPLRIYVHGSSLAGFAAPMAGLRDPTIAGLIIATAPSGMLSDWALRQRQFRTDLHGDVTAFDQRAIRASKARADAISAWVTRREAPRDLSVHRSYYAHMGRYRPEDAAYRLLMPIFVISVDRDRIVPAEDAETWIESLRYRPNVAFRLYRSHNHSLMDEREITESSSVTGEYSSWSIISDIATWIEGEWPDRWCADQEAWYAGCRGG